MEDGGEGQTEGLSISLGGRGRELVAKAIPPAHLSPSPLHVSIGCCCDCIIIVAVVGGDADKEGEAPPSVKKPGGKESKIPVLAEGIAKSAGPLSCRSVLLGAKVDTSDVKSDSDILKRFSSSVDGETAFAAGIVRRFSSSELVAAFFPTV